MAKPLAHPQPRSSVASLLDPGVGAAATRPAPGIPAFPPAGTPADEPARTGEPANIKREFVLTRGADETLRKLVALCEQATGTRLTNSHVLRAILRALELAMPELEREAARLGPLKRPSNAKGNEADRDEFEQRLAACLHAGLRACPPAD
jgi:hypothetical protein